MNLKDAILDLLYPPKCVFCQKIEKSHCCPACTKAYLGQPQCREGMYFTQCWAALRYTGVVRDAIIRFKFQEQRQYGEVFGRILGRCIRENLDGKYDLLTWVPVSAQRRQERGFDQTELLAQAVSGELGIPLTPTLEKTRHTPPQSTLQGREARRKNTWDAYRVTDKTLLENQRILLIDDIITTGATLDAASRALLAGEAREVLAATLAQPVNHQDTCEETL